MNWKPVLYMYIKVLQSILFFIAYLWIFFQIVPVIALEIQIHCDTIKMKTLHNI